MKNLEMFIVRENHTIRECMTMIAQNTKGIVFVCENRRLLATVTDGDIRRYILADGDLEEPIAKAAHYDPLFVYEEDRNAAEAIMRKAVITALPVLDREQKIIDIIFLNNFDVIVDHAGQLNLPVVIMAGGKGTRLKPFTDILPKPLIPLEEKTITEHIMDRFTAYGCNQFYMIVNYKKNFIKSYFSDSDIEYNLKFIDEKEYLGTAGGLKLLKGKVSGDFFMSNCDILIDADYQAMIQYHVDKKCIITLVCARKKYQVPYGTVDCDGEGYVKEIHEKPDLSYNVNTGLYVINERFLDKIPDNTHTDMTDLITQCVKQGEKVGIYLIDEDRWLDTGQMQELWKTKQIINFNYRT